MRRSTSNYAAVWHAGLAQSGQRGGGDGLERFRLVGPRRDSNSDRRMTLLLIVRSTQDRAGGEAVARRRHLPITNSVPAAMKPHASALGQRGGGSVSQTSMESSPAARSLPSSEKRSDNGTGRGSA